MENRRKHTRYQAEVVAEVELAGDTLIGETRDVSQGGVSLVLEQPIDEGAEIDLVLVLTQEGVEDPDEAPFETRASVMWCAPTDEGKAMMGLRFSPLPPEHAQQLQRFLAALQQ